jgi:hypothetical protein
MNKLNTKRYVPSKSKVFLWFHNMWKVNPMSVSECMNITIGWLEHYECILEFAGKIWFWSKLDMN